MPVLSRVLPVRAPRRERDSISERSFMDLAAKVSGEPKVTDAAQRTNGSFHENSLMKALDLK